MNNGQRVAGAQQAGKGIVGAFVNRPLKAIPPFRHAALEGASSTRFPNGGDPVAVHQCARAASTRKQGD